MNAATKGTYRGDIEFKGKKIPPADPTISGSATELMRHLDLAEHEYRTLRNKLFGEGDDAGPVDDPCTTLETAIRQACQRMALLAGNLAVINARL